MDSPFVPPQRPTIYRAIFQALLLAAIMFTSLGGYLLVLKWRGGAAVVSTWTPLDEWFPFWPGWVWVYFIPYLVGPALIGMLSPATFWWYIRRGLVIVAVTLLIFVVFPTRIDTSHRSLERGNGITAALYNYMVEIDDPPANAAPSLHVSLTCLLLLALLRDFPRWWPIWSGFIALVWLATLVTKQHHVIDVATGILLAWFASTGFFRTIRI